MADKKVVTREGYEELKERLEYLKTTKRYEVAERLKIARGYGDLSENAEYEEAKQEQGFVEGEINELEAMIRNVEVLSEDEIKTDVISIGSIVKLLDTDFDEEEEYRIVGSAEANIKEGKLSNESPVGKALLGHKIGETVVVEVPAGKVNYKILEIRR